MGKYTELFRAYYLEMSDRLYRKALRVLEDTPENLRLIKEHLAYKDAADKLEVNND